MNISRRNFIKLSSLGIILSANSSFSISDLDKKNRQYHVSVSIDALEHEPELFDIFKNSGVSAVWIGSFFYGHWHSTPEVIKEWKKKFEAVGIPTYVINVPLGHPGDSLGSYSGDVPLTPPTRWKPGVDYNGKLFAGTSLHEPATEENVLALKSLNEYGIKKVFLDDDFRLAQSPGKIGGCFCEEHKKKFLNKYGYNDSDWAYLLDSIQKRSLSETLKNWIEFTCDDLTVCFKTMEKTVSEIELGIMVMYMGSEKAGIRLSDYKNNLFRVGEGMFDDNSFGTVKGKCNELFSVLFHRRFTSPERAFSETTAFPADKLSAKNMCAKLIISTITDVRNTMFMSGIQHFPKTHWEVLPSAMAKQAKLHAEIASHPLKGPFKHYWGMKSRYVSDDNPYSLWLALGIPFEVIEKIPDEGWTFVSDYDIDEIKTKNTKTNLISRKNEEGFIFVPETLEALFNLKQTIIPQLNDIPYILDEKPIVCAWYPSAKKILTWNLSENKENFTLIRGDKKINFDLESLDATLLPDLSD